MTRKHNDDLADAIALILVVLIFAWVYRATIIAWLEQQIANAISGAISFLETLIIALIELGIPLIIGYYIAEKLIDDYYWEDWKITIIAIAIIFGASHFLTGFFFLATLIGWGMGAKVFIRFMEQSNII